MPSKFISLAGVGDLLGISASQSYALVRTGALPAIKLGGRGQWRVNEDELENYIARMYAETKALVASRPVLVSVPTGRRLTAAAVPVPSER